MEINAYLIQLIAAFLNSNLSKKHISFGIDSFPVFVDKAIEEERVNRFCPAIASGIDSISPPENLETSPQVPTSSSRRASSFFYNEGKDAIILSSLLNNNGLLRGQLASLQSRAIAKERSLFEDILNAPIGAFHTLLLDLILSPLGAIAFFFTIKPFLVRELLKEATKSYLSAEFESQIDTDERLTIELENRLANIRQAQQQYLEFLTHKVEDENTHLKQIKLLLAEWISQIDSIHSKLYPQNNEWNADLGGAEPDRRTEEYEFIFSYKNYFDSLVRSKYLLFDNCESISAEIYIKEAVYFCREKRYEEAIASYEIAIAIAPNVADEAWYRRGNILCLLQRHQEAIASYDRALQIQPCRSEVWYDRGNSYSRLQCYGEAVKSYEKAIQIDPKNYNFWYHRGNALGRLHHNREAVASYDCAIALNPQKYDSWYNRGNALARLQEYEEAVISYDRALTIKPEKYECWYNRGNALGRLQRYQDAIASYNRAIAIKPDSDEVWHNRGVMLGELKNYQAAIASYERAIQINPDNYESWHNHRIIQEKLSRF